MSTLSERLVRAQSDMEQTFSSMYAAPPMLKSNTAIVKLPLSQLHPFQAHTFELHKEREDYIALVNSISENGILEPILVRPIRRKANEYEIIMGHRRSAAAAECGFVEVPCIIQDMNDLDARYAMIETNINRPGWTPSEKARSYALHLQTTEAKLARQPGRPAADRQCSDYRRTDEIAAEFFGISRDTLHRFIKLNDLSPTLLDYVDSGIITVMAGYQIAFLDSTHQAMIAHILDLYPQKRISEGIASSIKSAYTNGELSEPFLLHLFSVESPEKKPPSFRISFQSAVASPSLLRKAMADVEIQKKVQIALDNILSEYIQTNISQIPE